VSKTFKQVNIHKAAGPDRLPGRVLTNMHWPTGKYLHWHVQPLPVWVCNTNMFQADHHSPCAQEH
jgi:hypothetical protein